MNATPALQARSLSIRRGARVTLHTGMRVDLKVVEPDQFGNVLQHFTGAKAPNSSQSRPTLVRCSPARGTLKKKWRMPL